MKDLQKQACEVCFGGSDFKVAFERSLVKFFVEQKRFKGLSYNLFKVLAHLIFAKNPSNALTVKISAGNFHLSKKTARLCQNNH
ncbi:MAG: hypothetical protein PUP90_17140 [Nostoc sp. S4]|nr:hypothetical protein [Nostoc sp. S4]